MEYIDVVRDILEEKLDIDRSQVNEDSTVDDLGLDSLDLVELICELEDHLGVDFGDPEGLETVGDIVAYIGTLEPNAR